LHENGNDGCDEESDIEMKDATTKKRKKSKKVKFQQNKKIKKNKKQKHTIMENDEKEEKKQKEEDSRGLEIYKKHMGRRKRCQSRRALEGGRALRAPRYIEKWFNFTGAHYKTIAPGTDTFGIHATRVHKSRSTQPYMPGYQWKGWIYEDLDKERAEDFLLIDKKYVRPKVIQPSTYIEWKRKHEKYENCKSELHDSHNTCVTNIRERLFKVWECDEESIRKKNRIIEEENKKITKSKGIDFWKPPVSRVEGDGVVPNTANIETDQLLIPIRDVECVCD